LGLAVTSNCGNLRAIMTEANKTLHGALSAKEERYCQLAAVTSYAEAYREAYNPNPSRPYHKDIWALNGKEKIAGRIREIQDANNATIGATREWLLRWWYYRMIYDPAEITAWAIGACRHCYGDDHEYQWRAHEYMRELSKAEALVARRVKDVELPDIAGGFGYDATKPPADDCPHCHGKGVGRADIADTSKLTPMARAAFEGIKETAQGIEIKMADKGKAAEQFAKLSGFDVAQVRIMGEKIPDEEGLAALAKDPIAAAAAYKRIMGSTQH
jgi:phage terminase small subunit